MNLERSWTIARKDFSIFRRKASILYSLVAFPLGVALGLPIVLWLVVQRAGVMYADLTPLMDSFAFFFVVGVVALSNGLASYSIVGEKVQKSLEPLLATPTTDSEILLGKIIASFLPTFVAVSLGGVIYMAFIDALSHGQLGYFYYPNWSIAIFLLLVAPLSCLFSVEVNVLLSARVSDVRTAQQTGGLLVLPFAALYVASEIQLIQLDTPTLVRISAALVALDLVLFSLSRATFRREEILTKWK